MTVREAFLRVMRFQPTDRVPNWEMGCWGQAVQRWVDEGLPPEHADEGHFGNPYLGTDKRADLPVRLGPFPSLGGEVLEETDRHIVFRDDDGAVRKSLKEGTVRGCRLCMDQFISFAIETPRDFDQIKHHYDPASPERYPQDLQALAASVADRDYPLCPINSAGGFGLYSQARRILGTEATSYAWYDEPRAMHEMLDFFTDFLIETIRPVVAAIPCDYFNFWEDCCFRSSALLSPTVFREFLLPRYRRIIAFLAEYGIDIIWCDSDGCVSVLLPAFIEAGVTCTWPVEVVAGNDPLEIRRRYGHSIAMAGGIDKRALFGDKAAIRAEVMTKIPPLLEDGGFIPHIDGGPPPEIPYDNLLYYLELKADLLGAELPVPVRERRAREAVR